MIPSTVERVPLHTAPHVNERIRRRTEQKIVQVIAAGPAAIERRLKELDREWDIERTLEANAASASRLSILLSLTGLPVLLRLRYCARSGVRQDVKPREDQIHYNRPPAGRSRSRRPAQSSQGQVVCPVCQGSGRAPRRPRKAQLEGSRASLHLALMVLSLWLH